jgi:hypothetical protein
MPPSGDTNISGKERQSRLQRPIDGRTAACRGVRCPPRGTVAAIPPFDRVFATHRFQRNPTGLGSGGCDAQGDPRCSQFQGYVAPGGRAIDNVVVGCKTKPTIRISTGIYNLAIGDDGYFLFYRIDWRMWHILEAILSVTVAGCFQIRAVFMSNKPCYANVIDKYLYNNAPVWMSRIPNPPVNKIVGALIDKAPHKIRQFEAPSTSVQLFEVADC